MKKRRLLSAFLVAVVVISMLPFKALTVSAVPSTSSIALVVQPDFVFANASEGYGAQAPNYVSVSNTGSEATGALNVGLRGSNPTAFSLSATAISSIAAGSSTGFSVVPVTGLSGRYIYSHGNGIR